MKHCKWCDQEFKSDITYQIYCSSACRESATREKIAARYVIARRQKRRAQKRVCKNCGNSLSIFNDDVLCNECNINPIQVAKVIKQIRIISNDSE
jgi:hypothetical protein